MLIRSIGVAFALVLITAGPREAFAQALLEPQFHEPAWRTRTEAEPGVTVGTAADPGWSYTIAIARRPAKTAASAALPEASHAIGADSARPARPERDGLASYYWQGERTASGEPFDRRALTAAHRTLPFGSKVKVTSLATGRSVTVRINDRGPFKPGRVIDLSEGAAEELGMRQSGLVPVRLDLLAQ